MVFGNAFFFCLWIRKNIYGAGRTVKEIKEDPMKKFLSVALSFALTLGACFGFAACGDEEGGSGGSTGGW